jgi:hypothetical protein
MKDMRFSFDRGFRRQAVRAGTCEDGQVSYDEKTLSERPPQPAAEPWDSGKHVAPDPSLPIEDRLKWYEVASHVLLLNVSERCRRQAAAAADKELARARV